MDVFVFLTVAFFIASLAFFAGIFFGSDDAWNGPWRADDATVDLVRELSYRAGIMCNSDLEADVEAWMDEHRPIQAQMVAKVRPNRQQKNQSSPRAVQPRLEQSEPVEIVLGPPKRQPTKLARQTGRSAAQAKRQPAKRPPRPSERPATRPVRR